MRALRPAAKWSKPSCISRAAEPWDRSLRIESRLVHYVIANYLSPLQDGYHILLGWQVGAIGFVPGAWLDKSDGVGSVGSRRWITKPFVGLRVYDSIGYLSSNRMNSSKRGARRHWLPTYEKSPDLFTVTRRPPNTDYKHTTVVELEIPPNKRPTGYGTGPATR